MTWCGCCRYIPELTWPTSSLSAAPGERMSVSPQHRASTGERINTAETTGRLQQALGKRRIRLTRQRRGALPVMGDAEQDLDGAQILERPPEKDSGRGLGTRFPTIYPPQ